MHLSLSFRGLLISRFSGLCRSCFTCTRTLCISRQIAPQMVTMLLHTARWCYFETKCYRCDRQLTALTSGAARGKGEASPPWVDVQKLCNMCVLSLSWNFFVSHDKYIARPSSHVDTETIQTGLGDFVLWTPYRPIPHFPPVTKSWRRHWP